MSPYRSLGRGVRRHLKATLPWASSVALLLASACNDRAAPAGPDGGTDAASREGGTYDAAGAEIAQQAPDGEAHDDRMEGDVAPAVDGGATADDAGTDAGALPDAGAGDGGETAPSCTPGARCVSASVSRICDAEGETEKDVSCSLGCLAEGPRAGACRQITPSNAFTGLTCGDGLSSPVSFDVREDTEVDPDHGAYSTVTSTIFAAPVYQRVFQGGTAPPVGVFHLGHLFIAEGTTLTLRRGADSAVVFLVDGDVDVEGTLDLSAHLATTGAGAVSLGSGGGGTSVAGGGGAGFGTPGAAGGATSGGTPGVPGTTYGSSTLIPLWGGSPGASHGGGGGGAVQISACGSLRVGLHGRILASGGGGPAASAGVVVPGMGGGSGGGISLEASQIAIEGQVVANGGGGGGSSNETVAGSAGEDGAASLSVGAQGGTCAGGGRAGAGSAAMTPAQPADAVADGGPSGGGGGGLGRIRFAARPISEGGGGAPTVVGLVSPAPVTEDWPSH